MRYFKDGLEVLVVGLTVVACGENSTASDPEPCTAETGSVTATVSIGQAVIFDWEPRCAVALLLVEDDGSDVWAINTDDSTWDDPEQANRISPPVTYGIAPPAIPESYGPLALVDGTTYELVLWRILPEGSTVQCQRRLENACLLAVHAFAR